MSASSARPLRDHGIASVGVSAKPSKTLTPIWISGKNPPVGLQRSSSCGKENPRPTSRARDLAQKPVIRPVPLVDKAVASVASVDLGNHSGTRVRWSMLLAPRGRSPSPSELNRVFSDRRVSMGATVRVVGVRDWRVESIGRGLGIPVWKGSEGKSNGVREWRQFGENEWDCKSNPISLSFLFFFFLKKKKKKKKKKKGNRVWRVTRGLHVTRSS